MVLINDRFFHRRYKNNKEYHSMNKTSIHMGNCLGNEIKNSTSYWAVLNHYGISKDDLKKLDLSYEELYKVYKTIQQHEQVRNFLKDFKGKIANLNVK